VTELAPDLVTALRQIAAGHDPWAGGRQRPLTDLGNAERLIDLHGAELRFDYTRKKWVCWDQRRWAEDTTGEVERRAKEAVRLILDKAKRCNDPDRREKLAKWAMQSESAPRIRSMLELARSVLPIESTAFDTMPLAFNVLNGTIDLRTGTIAAHDPAAFHSKLAPVEYDPTATCPLFEKFLSRIFACDDELITFVQRAVGYSLTGITSEHVVFFCWGSGANGKTTLVEVLRALFGDYGQQMPAETLLVRRQGGGIPNDVARLRGVRLAAAQETGLGRRLDESLLKRLTGGDTVVARYLFGEFFEFVPSAKLWIATNHKPVVWGTEEAIWRRIPLIPFTVTIPQRDRDGDLPTKLKDELPGILNWAIEGCLAWQQRRGLEPPDVVLGATAEYRREMDVLGTFLDEHCLDDPSGEVSVKDLYEKYSEWCKESGEYKHPKNTFGTRLTERGIQSGRTGAKGRLWKGIRLRISDDDLPF
jgi:putative DNA primase/helicase